MHSPRRLKHSVLVLLAPRRLPVIGVAKNVVVACEDGIRVGVPGGSQKTVRVVQLRVFPSVGHCGHVGKSPSVWCSKHLNGKRIRGSSRYDRRSVGWRRFRAARAAVLKSER